MSTIKLLTKAVAYAYPTSPDAVRFGFGNTGCYTVEMHQLNHAPKPVAAYATEAEARSHCERLPMEYSRHSL